MSQYFSVTPAAYVIVRKDDKVLLLKRAHTGYRDGYYAFPAGHIDGGESARQAAVRELKEETGVTATEADMKFVHVMHRVAEEGDHERVDFFFTTSVWQGEPYIAEPHKCDDVQWFPVDNLPSNTTPITLKVLDLASTGVTYSDQNFSTN